MAVELDVYNLQGKKEEKLSVSDAVFAVKVNKGLLHLCVLQFLANRRAGTACTKTKSEIRGGGKKPFMQKHTGNARRGSSRSPLQVGGGVAFGPKPRSYEFSINKKAKKNALCSALTDKLADVVVFQDFAIKAAKTKEVTSVLKTFKVTDTVLFVDAGIAETFIKSARNITGVKAMDVSKLNVYEVLKHTKLFITKSAVKKLEETLA